MHCIAMTANHPVTSDIALYWHNYQRVSDHHRVGPPDLRVFFAVYLIA